MHTPLPQRVISDVLSASSTSVLPRLQTYCCLEQTTFGEPVVANSRGHSESYDGVNVKPSSIQPVTPPIIIFTGKPSRARRNAALLAPLQCGPAQ